MSMQLMRYLTAKGLISPSNLMNQMFLSIWSRIYGGDDVLAISRVNSWS